jgi:4-amino-4-deoxy-L-arabinose transferase-like glycosyltransferase
VRSASPEAGIRRSRGRARALTDPSPEPGPAPVRLLAALMLMIGFAILLLPSLGQAPIERAEIYFLDGARSMIERGDWLIPYYRGEPFFDKPPLTYWLMASAFHLFGMTPGAARLVPAGAALGVLASTMWLGLLLFGRRTALVGASVLATSLAFAVFGRVAMSDMLLTLWSTLAVALGVRASREGSGPWVAALGAVLGLGFLTKGPVAVLFPGLALLLVLVESRGRVPRLARPTPLLGGLALAAFVGLSWFVAVYVRLGSGPLEYFFLRENFERFAGDTYDSGRSPFFYVFTYLAEGLPWSLFLPLAIRRWWRREGPGHRAQGLLLLWVGLMLVPLSLSRGKIDYYLLPLYPALSLLIGCFFAGGPFDRFERIWTRAVLVLLAAALVLLPLACRAIAPDWLPGQAAVALVGAVAVVGGLAGLVAAVRPRPERVLGVLGATSACVFVGLVTLFLPAFWSAQPNAALVADIDRERGFRPEAQVVACADPSRVERDLLFYSRVVVTTRCDLWSLAPSRSPFLFLLAPAERASLASVPGFREISSHRYLPATVLTFDGLLEARPPGVITLAANYGTEDPVAETKRKQDRKREMRLLWPEAPR